VADPFPIQTTPVSIASGQSLSPEVDIGSKGTLVGIQVPANWTTAGISLQVSFDGGVTWCELTTVAGTPYAIGSVTGGTLVYFVAIDPTTLRGVNAIKVRSGTQAAPVAQANTVNLLLVSRYIF
jgi:hypothetical protein